MIGEAERLRIQTVRRIFKFVLPLAALVAGAKWIASIRRQRRNPEPFPASQARLLDNPVARMQAAKVIGMMDLRPGMRVIDVGAGVGRLSIPIAGVVGPDGGVVAHDVQQEMLDILEKRAADVGLSNIETVRAVAGDGMIQAEAFDCAILASVLGEIPHARRIAALREIRDGLKPGGILYVAETLGDPHYQTRAATFRQGEGAGFSRGKSRQVWPGHLTELVKPV